MHQPGNHVRSAGRSPAPEDQSQARAQHDAAEQRAQQRIMADRSDRNDIDQHGKQNRRDQAAEGKHLAHRPVADDEQWNIQQQGHQSDRGPQQVVQDRRNARQAARRDAVGDQEGRIGRGPDHAAQQDLQVAVRDFPRSDRTDMCF